MNFLYDDSNGPVYKKLMEWLDNVDEDLRITAILAVGNFARTDIHCKRMVEQGIHRKLLKLLQIDGSKSTDIRYQHALLSALRNLVIPAENKSVILVDGLIDVLYPMLDIPTFPIVFKLLGTLRIVIDGQSKYLYIYLPLIIQYRCSNDLMIFRLFFLMIIIIFCTTENKTAEIYVNI